MPSAEQDLRNRELLIHRGLGTRDDLRNTGTHCIDLFGHLEVHLLILLRRHHVSC